MKFAEVVAVVREAKMTVETREFDFADDQIGLAGNSISDDRTFYAGKNCLHVGLVERQHDSAVERDAIHEFEESGLDFFERMILIEMLPVDGGDDGYDRRKQEKRAIAFVRFYDHVVALAGTRVGSCGVDAAAHDESGIESRSRQNGGDERSGGGFSVRAGDGDSIF